MHLHSHIYNTILIHMCIICEYVYVSVCVRAYAYVCAHIFVCVCTRAYLCVCVSVCMHTRMCLY